MKKITKILSVLLVCLVFLSACGSKEDKPKDPDYRAFMMTISEKYVKEKFGASKVKVSTKDYAAILTPDPAKTYDGKSYNHVLLASGKINIDGEDFKYQIIAAVDDPENPMKYTVLNFETIDKESQYFYDNLDED